MEFNRLAAICCTQINLSRRYTNLTFHWDVRHRRIHVAMNVQLRNPVNGISKICAKSIIQIMLIVEVECVWMRLIWLHYVERLPVFHLWIKTSRKKKIWENQFERITKMVNWYHHRSMHLSSHSMRINIQVKDCNRKHTIQYLNIDRSWCWIADWTRVDATMCTFRTQYW